MQNVLVLSGDRAKTKWLAFDIIKLVSCVTISHCGTKNFTNDGSWANKNVINIIAQKLFFPRP